MKFLCSLLYLICCTSFEADLLYFLWSRLRCDECLRPCAAQLAQGWLEIVSPLACDLRVGQPMQRLRTCFHDLSGGRPTVSWLCKLQFWSRIFEPTGSNCFKTCQNHPCWRITFLLPLDHHLEKMMAWFLDADQTIWSHFVLTNECCWLCSFSHSHSPHPVT